MITPQDFDEIGGCTVEGDHHLISFDIRRDDGGPLWSGCCGIGLNRLAIGFLFQHGFDPSDWPDEVSKAVLDAVPLSHPGPVPPGPFGAIRLHRVVVRIRAPGPPGPGHRERVDHRPVPASRCRP